MFVIILGSCIIVVLYLLAYLIGSAIESKLSEQHSIKKFWRKHILAPDPNEPEDGETRY